MSGSLVIIGTGPGNPGQTTPQTFEAIAASDVFFGYGPYLDRLDLRPDQVRMASDNREEIDRARAALDAAMRGAKVCVVSGGDPGVFAMAAAICEAVENGPETWRRLDIRVLPGVTAMLAVAARAGAPLGHDFCAISLSDNLKPWDLIERRLRAVAEAGLVIALYNPISKARPWQLSTAFKLLREVLPVTTPVIFGRAVGRSDESFVVVPLGEADRQQADMATCVIIGSAETRIIERPGLDPLVYSPRGVGL
ncbi:precorrin-3B C(17)-methyltransferase [Devosia chinhatensis]|uniref:Precorrin-3B C17-methyltransferase n=1 Tax=Devosia chinhatensis TaxID=429727 RepID=A0A0F5FJI5_9HYPH|nr:precorrin-3B C(17)-methyltransferase [Devosia chinhatensis]KKB08973.1 precorrin-3B C17-methyltransferase [Devosia chinhatensis]